MEIVGVAKKDKKTKNLVNRLNPKDIAIIKHKDIDEIAAHSLIESKVQCVINTEKSISGKYPNRGPSLLLKSGIPLLEAPKDFFEKVKENKPITIKHNKIYQERLFLGKCEIINDKKVKELLELGNKNLENELDKFIENTLEYAKKEKGLVLGKVKIPRIKTKLAKKHVLIVVRGKDYKRDLEAIKSYIDEVNPVLIGVDGGGDALLEQGYIPDIVVGDLDSVSDKCLLLTKEIIVHAYPDGRAPGLNRIKKLGLNAVTFPAPGTSEDISLLLAYNYDASLIVAVGTHSNMIDFLEKGRKGMASTFLVRLKVGSKLVDAKGVNQLYKSKLKLKYIFGLGLAALIPIIIISLMAPPMRELIQLFQIKLKLLIGM
ncbi:putative cytokinetic ring protein SteA [Thermohalobacter berrensis]|uniref:Thiamine pyrophosphokinase n=1 Tax=Thermohalobacter berrensis TaxID=99594 RepID=A0A419TAP6_9FIRM|nr:putative cytokinetic ring protein SteA [Thermohalobacter berrensis]RKD34558.1 thiamine pyrophosphokinase [Thermohalobacter berrensis]